MVVSSYLHLITLKCSRVWETLSGSHQYRAQDILQNPSGRQLTKKLFPPSEDVRANSYWMWRQKQSICREPRIKISIKEFFLHVSTRNGWNEIKNHPLTSNPNTGNTLRSKSLEPSRVTSSHPEPPNPHSRHKTRPVLWNLWKCLFMNLQNTKSTRGIKPHLKPLSPKTQSSMFDKCQCYVRMRKDCTALPLPVDMGSCGKDKFKQSTCLAYGMMVRMRRRSGWRPLLSQQFIHLSSSSMQMMASPCSLTLSPRLWRWCHDGFLESR